MSTSEEASPMASFCEMLTSREFFRRALTKIEAASTTEAAGGAKRLYAGTSFDRWEVKSGARIMVVATATESIDGADE